ncbi:MAG: IS1595 family transposase [Candidatus Aenigmatarchaeota archaeon]|jgi:transposase-like protein
MKHFLIYALSHICADLLKRLRWKNGIKCPYCGSSNVVKNGRYGKFKEFHKYKCKACSKNFNDKTATLFANSKIPIYLWFGFFFLFFIIHISFRKGRLILKISIFTLRKMFFRTVERWRELAHQKFYGEVEMDEKYIKAGYKGQRGKPKLFGRKPRKRGPKGKPGRGTWSDDKIPVVSIVMRGKEKKKRLICVRDVSCWTLRGVAMENICYGSKVYTDERRGYNLIPYEREVVEHGSREYAKGKAHVNNCENLHSLLYLFVEVHRGVNKEYLQKYLDGFIISHQVWNLGFLEGMEKLLKIAIYKISS